MCDEIKKRECISLLRIISCFMVVGIHSTIYIPYGDSLQRYLGQGQIGLWIFMVLSGYLVSLSYEKDNCDTILYYKKRIIRIVPLYWSYLLILMIVGKLTGWFELSAWDWIRQFLFCNLIIPSNNWHGMWALGSLSSFFFFYLIGPFLIKRIRTVDKGIIALMIGITARLLCPLIITKFLSLQITAGVQSDIETFAYHMPFCTIVFFIVGIVIFRVEQLGGANKLLMLLVLVWMAALIISANTIRVVAFSGLVVSMVVLFPMELPKCICKFNKLASPYTFPLYICHYSVFDLVSHFMEQQTVYGYFMLLACPFIVMIIIHLCIEKPLTSILNKHWVLKKSGKR